MTQNSPGEGNEPTADGRQWPPPSFPPPAEPEREQAKSAIGGTDPEPGAGATWQSPGGQPVYSAPAWQSPGGQANPAGSPAWQSPGGQPVSGVPAWQPSSAPPHAGAPGWPPAPPAWRPAGPMPPAWVQGQPQGPGQWAAGPRPVAYPSPVRFEGVPGEPFALAILPTPKVVSGASVGALVAGIGSILVSGAVWCFGLAGSSQEWGALVGGAFFVLAALLGLAAVGLGVVGLRNIKRDLSRVSTGKGYAISGISCGGVGVVSAVLGLATAIILSQAA